jgi:hypothetical protein
MNTITAIAIALWIVTIIGYVIFNLYRKNRKLEQMVINQQVYINNFLSLSREVDKAAEQIDSKIWVQSDPEFLQLMETVKGMQESIRQYTESN